jgi:ribosomal protein S18 acetylase RimI-like enzyme
VALRALRNSEVGVLEDWVPPLAASLGVARWSEADALTSAVSDRAALLYVDAAGEAFLSYIARTQPTRFVQIDFIAVPPAKRRLGLGGRAALALEKRLAREHGRVLLSVPASAGLALYFWLRLGYRPLLRSQWPTAVSNTIWMERELR